MGRYLRTLAVAFADAADVRAGDRLLDVGCGPGGLTTELVRRTGSSAVCAIDPSPPFVAAWRVRNPSVGVREGAAEELPWPDGDCDVCLASLVIGLMADPSAGVREMQAGLVGRRRGQQSDLLTAAALATVAESALPATAAYADLDAWWFSFTGETGPVGPSTDGWAPTSGTVSGHTVPNCSGEEPGPSPCRPTCGAPPDGWSEFGQRRV